MGFPVSGCGTRGFAAHTVLARDDTEKPHLLPTAPAIVRPANTPPLVVADLRIGFDNGLFFFSDRFELATLELFIYALAFYALINEVGTHDNKYDWRTIDGPRLV